MGCGDGQANQSSVRERPGDLAGMLGKRQFASRGLHERIILAALGYFYRNSASAHEPGTAMDLQWGLLARRKIPGMVQQPYGVYCRPCYSENSAQPWYSQDPARRWHTRPMAGCCSLASTLPKIGRRKYDS